MAGRPKTMAVKVTRLEDEARRLCWEVYEAMPQQYIEDPDPKGAISYAWNDAYYKVRDAMCAVEELAEQLRSKAGLTRAECNVKIQEALEREARAKKAGPLKGGSDLGEELSDSNDSESVAAGAPGDVPSDDEPVSS